MLLLNVMTEADKALTVTELTRGIKKVLSDGFDDIKVEGELSNFLIHSSGHLYASLKDENSVIKLVMFKGANLKLKFKPVNGMNVIVHGRVDVYEKSGQYQIIADYIEEADGRGSLQKKFEELRDKLVKEGLIVRKSDGTHHRANPRPIPGFPEKIGIVTSPTGAAIQDMLNIIDRRFSNVTVVLDPVKVQGDGAAEEIAEAVARLNSLGGFDVIIVGRGGGSIEDLWAFNEESVARAIYASEAPVISAVGHEIDFTIADFVADLRAPTPSAAAELVVKDKNDIIAVLEGISARLNQALSGMVDRYGEKVAWLGKTGLSAALKQTVEVYKERLNSLRKNPVLVRPGELVNELRQEIDDLDQRAIKAYGHFMELKRSELAHAISRLEGLNPLKILERGYSVTVNRTTGLIIRDSRDLKKGDMVELRFAKGSAGAEITETK